MKNIRPLIFLELAAFFLAAFDDIYSAHDCVVTGTTQLQRGVVTATITLAGDCYVKLDHDDGAYGTVDLGVYNGWENAGTTDCDRDADRLIDKIEYELSTNPLSRDTDGDVDEIDLMLFAEDFGQVEEAPQ